MKTDWPRTLSESSGMDPCHSLAGVLCAHRNDRYQQEWDLSFCDKQPEGDQLLASRVKALSGLEGCLRRPHLRPALRDETESEGEGIQAQVR